MVYDMSDKYMSYITVSCVFCLEVSKPLSVKIKPQKARRDTCVACLMHSSISKKWDIPILRVFFCREDGSSVYLRNVGQDLAYYA